MISWPQPCKRCGAQVAGYMDIDFVCERRPCGIRRLLKAKDAMAAVAMNGPEPEADKREALRCMFETMLWASQHLEDDEL